ncbi:hydroxyacylglutathione hydrolase [Acidithiobacillus sp.]|uniref:hydroxyacylglutathione hydrolase n=1 Tax=Acidithiobacillus sp. TaxID=1872118 RepID=UPI00261E7B1B|nr:hydroxyacylglutathione hydrolase [Acidithiobacillus sp.]MDD5280771.1 hydroxyacylglutathione hydrolase [Acidithiobacillus sp.]
MSVHFIPAFADNYIYVLESSAGVWIVDPGDVEPVFQWLAPRQMVPTAILCTHHHADHTGGVAALADHFRIPVYGANDRIPALTHPVAAGKLTIGSAEIQVMEVPGHTRDHIAYVWNASLFCGDTLFAAGCGRLFEGTPEMLFHSLQQLAALPPETAVYCAHEYTRNNLRFAALVDPGNPVIRDRQIQAQKQRERGQPTLPSSIALERASNPFLRCADPALIASARHFDPLSGGTALSVFTALRRWKDQFS